MAAEVAAAAGVIDTARRPRAAGAARRRRAARLRYVAQHTTQEAPSIDPSIDLSTDSIASLTVPSQPGSAGAPNEHQQHPQLPASSDRRRGRQPHPHQQQPTQRPPPPTTAMMTRPGTGSTGTARCCGVAAPWWAPRPWGRWRRRGRWHGACVWVGLVGCGLWFGGRGDGSTDNQDPKSIPTMQIHSGWPP